jgi:enoyl-[acyl-carrier-protein] reductase (NADH)
LISFQRTKEPTIAQNYAIEPDLKKKDIDYDRKLPGTLGDGVSKLDIFASKFGNSNESIQKKQSFFANRENFKKNDEHSNYSIMFDDEETKNAVPKRKSKKF